MPANVITNTPQVPEVEVSPEPDQDIHLSNEIQPAFPNLDETAVRKWFTAQTKYLRDKGAVVNGPTTSEHKRVAGQLREVKELTKKDKVDENTGSVWECFYEWRYKEENPVTLRVVEATELDSLRVAAQQAMARRWE